MDDELKSRICWSIACGVIQGQLTSGWTQRLSRAVEDLKDHPAGLTESDIESIYADCESYLDDWYEPKI